MSVDIEASLRKIAADILEPNVWTEDTPARALSSMELMRVVVRIERTLRVRFPAESLGPETFESMSKLVGVVGALLEREARRSS